MLGADFPVQAAGIPLAVGFRQHGLQRHRRDLHLPEGLQKLVHQRRGKPGHHQHFIGKGFFAGDAFSGFFQPAQGVQRPAVFLRLHVPQKDTQPHGGKADLRRFFSRQMIAQQRRLQRSFLPGRPGRKSFWFSLYGIPYLSTIETANQSPDVFFRPGFQISVYSFSPSPKNFASSMAHRVW